RTAIKHLAQFADFYISSTIFAEEECRRPLAFSSCSSGTARTIFSFFNATNQCESYVGCDKGTNRFDTHRQCVGECPYGKFSGYHNFNSRVLTQ
ncbi:secreted protein, putative, partial [Ixodes scapularis]